MNKKDQYTSYGIRTCILCPWCTGMLWICNVIGWN